MAGAGLPGRRLSAYWGVIQRAVTERRTTAELWADIRAAAAQMGRESPGISAAQVGRERGRAAAIRNAGDQLARVEAAAERTGTDPALDASVIAEAPWARPLPERNALPMWQVNFDLTLTTAEGETFTTTVSSILRGPDIPDTLSGLHDAVAEDAEAMAEKYGHSLVGTGAAHILAV